MVELPVHLQAISYRPSMTAKTLLTCQRGTPLRHLNSSQRRCLFSLQICTDPLLGVLQSPDRTTDLVAVLNLTMQHDECGKLIYLATAEPMICALRRTAYLVSNTCDISWTCEDSDGYFQLFATTYNDNPLFPRQVTPLFQGVPTSQRTAFSDASALTRGPFLP